MVAFVRFNENDANLCIHLKMCTIKFKIIVLFDDISLEDNVMSLTVKTSKYCLHILDMKDLNNVFLLLGIWIHHDSLSYI